jgi:hypothetical protein
MTKFKVLSGTFCIFLIIINCGAKPRNDGDDDDDERTGPTKKIDDKTMKPTIDALRRLVEDLPQESFKGDVVLDQIVDTLNDYTSYKLADGGKKSPSVYERKSNDLNKEAIVLLPSEDTITVRKAKKTFIGLRRTGTDSSKYYAFFIYLRYVE